MQAEVAQVNLVREVDLPREDLPLEAVREAVGLLLVEVDLVDVIGHGRDVAEKRAHGRNEVLRGFDAGLREFEIVAREVGGNLRAFHGELVQRLFRLVDHVVDVLEQAEDVAAVIRNQGLAVEARLDLAPQGVGLALEHRDRLEVLLEALLVLLKVVRDALLEDERPLADRIEKLVDLRFEGSGSLEQQRHPVTHRCFGLRPTCTAWGCRPCRGGACRRP